MIAYVDSSVILRRVLGQSGALKEWKALSGVVASALVEVECLRTLDRFRLLGNVSDPQVSALRDAVFRLLAEVEMVEPTRVVLSRAAQPLPTALGTLDAIHLATAILWRERAGADLTMATHDIALATAARASGFRVIGA
ncbi:MAG: type II toxin-antitoxin system VapC family toxin [Planctomycetes bacterium]|nr:type II toxin-antitoxin system VapC family toxin [Planctomycetota bacterium]MBI3846123.1 type II toxin-antitoxin system VapC family toxin [Planctomycetota bacterium]